MTALRNAATATQTVFDIDTPLNINTYPKPYTIDSEVVNVVGGGSATSITVVRGVGGSTAAAHVNGTALTAANAFSGGGGVENPLSSDLLMGTHFLTGTSAGGAYAGQMAIGDSSGNDGGAIILNAGYAAAAGDGGGLLLASGQGDDGAALEAIIDIRGGNAGGDIDGVIRIQTGGSSGPGPLVSDGTDVHYSLAAFVANGSTVDQLRDALIAAGLMAAS